jgi:Na+-transporting NADH:ubiquinone oxidoreductase subunit F
MTAELLTSMAVAVAFLAGMGLVLSALLILAERKILNYGACKISVNDGKKELSVRGGAFLLFNLAENDVFIPSACGGRGSCAYCKVKVLEGGGPLGPVEEPYLSPEEQADYIRLSCQVKVRRDMRIVIPEELFSVRKYTGILESKRPLTYDILELRIRLEEPDTIDFIAGQYVQLESEEYKGRDSVMRAYSMSSKPSDRNHIELIVRRVPDGIMTTWIFDYLEEGQNITFSGPYGQFCLTDTDAPMVFVAGGSGMAPMWSMIRDMKEKDIERPTTFFFGALTQKDLFFVDELNQLQEELPWFTFVPALSNEPEDSDWKGERGLITDVVAKYFPDVSDHEGYLCGSPGMVNACIAVLTDAEMPETCIYYDKFA